MNLFTRSPLEVTVDDNIFLHAPFSARLNERDIEVGQQIKPKRIGRPDGWAFFRPPFARTALDIHVFGRLRVEEVLTELEIVEHAARSVTNFVRPAMRAGFGSTVHRAAVSACVPQLGGRR